MKNLTLPVTSSVMSLHCSSRALRPPRNMSQASRYWCAAWIPCLCVLFGSVCSYFWDSNDNHIFAHGIILGAIYNIACLASVLVPEMKGYVKMWNILCLAVPCCLLSLLIGSYLSACTFYFWYAKKPLGVWFFYFLILSHKWIKKYVCLEKFTLW